MKDKRILYVSSEVIPYLPETETASTSFELSRQMHNSGAQIRIFMPRFGVINERRHQLHEVIRLSGMNLIIDDQDHPLIIKVASIQPARMQVYFIDNEEYFQRKAVFTDENEKFFLDNDERSIFFCRGSKNRLRQLFALPQSWWEWNAATSSWGASSGLEIIAEDIENLAFTYTLLFDDYGYSLQAIVVQK